MYVFVFGPNSKTLIFGRALKANAGMLKDRFTAGRASLRICRPVIRQVALENR